MNDVTPKKLSWQKSALIGGAIAIGLIAVAETGGDPKQAVPVKPSAPEVFAMPQPDHFALVIPAGTKPDALEGLAKEQCGDRAFCKVFGWTDRAQAARALPFTEREVATLAFSYQFNRTNDFEQLVFDCKRFPQPDPINCIGD